MRGIGGFDAECRKGEAAGGGDIEFLTEFAVFLWTEVKEVIYEVATDLTVDESPESKNHNPFSREPSVQYAGALIHRS